jgi:hypothetical protein
VQIGGISEGCHHFHFHPNFQIAKLKNCNLIVCVQKRSPITYDCDFDYAVFAEKQDFYPEAEK